MRPLRLKLKGLRSYLVEQEIDFSRAGLVAIVGDTGAGKSSLLEAICFALYGGATWNAREAKGLISDQAQALQVQFEFLADGKRWQVTRATSTGTYPPPLHELRCLDDPAFHVDKSAEVTRWIEKLIGLDYPAFLRAVVLPQGRFQELLQASASDRTRILKGIFRLDLLESMREVCDRVHSENDRRIHQLEMELAGMLPHPAETLERKGEEAARAKEAMDRLQDACGQIEEHLERALNHEKTAQELLGALASLHGALSTRPAERASKLCERAAPFLERQRVLEEQRAEATRTCKEIAERIAREETSRLGATGLATCEQDLAFLKRSLVESAASEREIAARETEIEALAKAKDQQAVALREIEKELDAATRRLAERREEHSAAAQKANEARSFLQSLRDREGEARLAAETATRLSSELANRTRERDALARDSRMHEEAYAQARLALEELRREHAAAHASAGCAPGDPCPVCQRELPADFRPRPVPEEAAAIEAVTRTENQARESAGALANLEGTIATLKKQCKEQEAAVEAARNRVQAARTKLEALLPLPQHEVSSDARAHGAGAAGSDRGAQVTIELATSPPTIEVDLEAAVLALTEGLPNLKAEEEEVRLKGEARDAARESLARIQADLKSTRTLQSKARDALEQSAAERMKSWTELLERLGTSPTDMNAESVDRIDAMIAQLRKVFESLQREERDARTRLQQIQQEELAHRKRQEEEITRPLLALGRELSVLGERIGQAEKVQEACAAPSPDSRTTKGRSKRRAGASEGGPHDSRARTAASHQEPSPESTQPADLVQWATNLETRARALEGKLRAEATAHTDQAVQTRRAAWRKYLAETALFRMNENESVGSSLRDASISEPPDEELDAELRRGLQSLQEALQEETFAYRSARNAMELAQAQLPRWTTLRDALDRARPVVDALAELSRLLSDGKFIGHVVQRQQRGLLAIASELLRDMSGGRFGFAESFEVVDLLTGQVRNVKTLSGGETFLASLALALGLVELAGRSGGRLDALFLDEGFGSLDANCLAEALDALSRQAEAGRLVVVISHLQAVAESIDHVLLVTRDEKGSHARWLHGTERETLVMSDARNGLLL